MKSSNRYVVLILLLLGAFASYSIGFGRGVFIFVVLGVLFELAFWFGLFGSQKREDES